jgi:predicted  nucleic acid-binding Zn-ribbon protein
MAGETMLTIAEAITDGHRAFAKIENLEHGQKALADAPSALEKRVRELEAGLREAKAETKLEAIRETQSIVNSVPGHLYQEIKQVSIGFDRLKYGSAPSEETARGTGAPPPALPDGG